MALQGSLTDLALPDVLGLLASTKKSGQLHVNGQGGDGRIWMDDGQVVAADAGVGGDAVDTLFELLQVTEGNFVFAAGVTTTDAGTPRAVEPLLAEASARLEEWREVAAVVPSLDTRVALVPDAPASPVIIEADQWRVLVAAADGGTVGAVADALSLGRFAACRSVKGIVDAGLLQVVVDERRSTGPSALDLDDLVELPNRKKKAKSEAEVSGEAEAEVVPSPTRRLSAAAARKAAAEAAENPEAASALARQLASLAGDGDLDDPIATVTPEEAAAMEDAGLIDENGEPINRSLLLKFLSSVRS